MTSQKDIQSLIADIDSILPKTDARLPWSKPGDVAVQRRVLERVRSYLVSQQQNFVAAPQKSPLPATSAQAEVVQQIAQAVTQEMHFLRADLLQPLQADVEALRSEREYLVREIQQLERTKQQTASPPQHVIQQEIISEFSQELISRCTESLSQQLAQILVNFEHRVNTESATAAISSIYSSQGNVGSVMQPQERLEQLRQMQVRSDQMLTTLDANQRAIFDALQRNLQSYQESLSQGLENMHRLGVQGEMLFTAFMNRLAQQLGREASTIFSSSLQLSDSSHQTEQTATSQTKPDTLLPLDALSVTEQNPLLGRQKQLQSLQSVDPLLREQENASSSADDQVVLPESQAIAQDGSLENLDSEDWELIEGQGLDFEDLGVELDDTDELDTFIQLNIDAQTSLPSVEENQTPSRYQMSELNLSSDNRYKEIQELYESIFGTDSLTGTAKPDEAHALTPQFLADFPFNDQLEGSESPQAPTGSQIPSDDQISSPDSLNPLSSQVEEVLFEGLADPAVERPQAQPLDWSTGQLPQSWEVLFFEDSVTHSPIEGNFVGAAQASPLAANSLSNSESSSQQEGIKIIAALTDLFEEMGLNHSSPAVEGNSVPATTTQGSEYQSSDTDIQASLVEENYIPASPEEDLLVTDELVSEPDIEIVLDQNTLQQLQQDLYSFEESEGQNFLRQEEQRSPGNDFEFPSIAPNTAQVYPQNQSFLMAEELLAEDWEELMHNTLPNVSASQSLTDSSTPDLSVSKAGEFDTDEENLTPASREEISASSTPTAPESVELDFEPELFPSELEQENAIGVQPWTTPQGADGQENSDATTPEELAIPGEPFPVGEETFFEMQWDEPIDGTTEEMISSPELEFELNSFPQETLSFVQEDAVSDRAAAYEEPAMPGELSPPDDEARSENAADESIDNAHDTTLPSQALDNESDVFLEEVPYSEQEGFFNVQPFEYENSEATLEEVPPPTELNPPDNEALALSEDEPLDSLTEAQRVDAPNIDTDLAQPEDLNPEHPDNEKN